MADLSELLERCLAEDPKKRPSAINIVDFLDGRVGAAPTTKETQIDSEDDFWYQQGGTHREDKKRLVWFPRRFASTPRVEVALSGFDTDQGKYLRVFVSAEDVTPYGFVVSGMLITIVASSSSSCSFSSS
jgi:serine/threonine protein kinase